MSKMRSPNYPAYSLRNCAEWASRLWVKEGRTAVDAEIVAVALGYKGLSGPSRTAIASMKKFGIIEEGNDGLRVSALALSILHPTKEMENRDALRQAALNPALFAQLVETHLNASAQAITSYLITKMGFSQTGATTCAEAFKDTVQFAKLEEVGEGLADESPQCDSKVAELISAEVPAFGSNSPPSRASIWPLAEGRFAQVSFWGDGITDEDIDLLCAYLNLAKRGLVKKGV